MLLDWSAEEFVEESMSLFLVFQEGEKKEEKKEKEAPKKKNKVKTLDLPVTENVPQLSTSQINVLYEKEVRQIGLLYYFTLFCENTNY